MHDEPTPDPSADDTADGAVDPSTIDAIGDELTEAAAGVEVGDAATMLTAVRSTAMKGVDVAANTVVGLAAAGTLVVSGAIVANLVGGNDGDDLLVRAPATEPATSEATEPDDAADTPPATVIADAPGDITLIAAYDPVPVRLVPAQMNDVVDPGVDDRRDRARAVAVCCAGRTASSRSEPPTSRSHCPPSCHRRSGTSSRPKSSTSFPTACRRRSPRRRRSSRTPGCSTR